MEFGVVVLLCGLFDIELSFVEIKKFWQIFMRFHLYGFGINGVNTIAQNALDGLFFGTLIGSGSTLS